VMALTNPNQESHKSTVKSKFHEIMGKKQEENNSKGAGYALGMAFGNSMVDMLIEKAVTLQKLRIFFYFKHFKNFK